MAVRPTAAAGRGLWCCLSAATLILALAIAAPAGAVGPCNTGVLQMVPPADPSTRSYIDSWCLDLSKQGTGSATSTSIKAICGVAFRATVTNGIVRLAPLELGSFPVGSPFDCKNMNASGLFKAGSTTAATLMLYDDLGAQTNLTKTGPNTVSLSVGKLEAPKGGTPIQCTYNYTVVSGCVLGAKAAGATAPPCPPGHVPKTGRFGLKYCSACPPGTYSPGGAAATRCIPCPIGTASDIRGAGKCASCLARGLYAPKTGLQACVYCEVPGGNAWTDGKTKCGTCPKGSIALPTKPQQCVRCYAGKKCCTVNADKDCPKCTSSAKPATYTSIFALESTTPASCLASNYALCAPKLNITIDGTCTITVKSLGKGNINSFTTCDAFNEATRPVQGASANGLRDLSLLNPTPADAREAPFSILYGNVTAAASPYLTIAIPTAKCAFRYRALTAPAAKLLGAAPKPNTASPAACPAGSYIDTSTDTKPGPCLPCPPGTYSAKPGTKASCTACPAGTYAKHLGSTRCIKCPVGTYSRDGWVTCSTCEFSSIPTTKQSGCTQCPKETYSYPGTGACLGNVLGNTCCAAGVCDSQARCPPVAKLLTTTFFSTMRLKSRSLSSPTCRNATFLSCLPAGAKVAIFQTGSNDVNVFPTAYSTCSTNRSAYIEAAGGRILATNRAQVLYFDDQRPQNTVYELLSNSKQRTLTMYLSMVDTTVHDVERPPTPLIRKECSATFELLTGYFLDLRQAPTATCPPAAISKKVGGRTVCTFCGQGNFKNSKGACQSCPVGTYQPLLDGASCKPCPAGFNCWIGSRSPAACTAGTFAPKAFVPKSRAGTCADCPAGTYSVVGATKACTKCPKGTISRKGSGSCGVPWATKF